MSDRIVRQVKAYAFLVLLQLVVCAILSASKYRNLTGFTNGTAIPRKYLFSPSGNRNRSLDLESKRPATRAPHLHERARLDMAPGQTQQHVFLQA